MTKRLGTAVAAATLTIGLLVGAAGAVLIGNATRPNWNDHMGAMTQIHDSMAGMMSNGMMGGGTMGSGGAWPGMDGSHDAHHPSSQP